MYHDLENRRIVVEDLMKWFYGYKLSTGNVSVKPDKDICYHQMQNIASKPTCLDLQALGN